ncbi:MAG: GNAT family N-acetyltransferase [Candidatus Magasanikbacteria bacterium]|nr:GNAT family N-acetyltransferase [Candidatus Magasanikbacteria bacterium]
MNLNVYIETPRLVIRTLRVEDASEKYARWLGDPEVNHFLETRQTSVDELRNYISEKIDLRDTLFLGIFWKENGDLIHIGNLKFEPCDSASGIAHMGIILGEKDFWGRGVATEVTNASLDYLKKELNIKTVTLGVFAEHVAAIRVYEKCGFSMDRILPETLIRSGREVHQAFMKKQLYD